jgi:hypothetical protein
MIIEVNELPVDIQPTKIRFNASNSHKSFQFLDNNDQLVQCQEGYGQSRNGETVERENNP